MASKLLMRATSRLRSTTAMILRTNPKQLGFCQSLPQLLLVRRVGLIPKTQYDIKTPDKFKLGYVLGVYWEIIPLLLTVCVSVTILVFSVAWAACHKVDVVYSSHSRDNLSHSMDLRNPPTHKIITINQIYEPWNEMQDSLDLMKKKMLEQERRRRKTAVCIGPETMPKDSIEHSKPQKKA